MLDMPPSSSHILGMDANLLSKLMAEAEADFGPTAMWWLRSGLDPSRHWRIVTKALREHGGHAGMLMAERIEGAANADD